MHKVIGPGLLESAYEKCLAANCYSDGFLLKNRNRRPSSTSTSSWSVAIVGILVDRRVVVELKAVAKDFCPSTKQSRSHISAYPLCKLGLLIGYAGLSVISVQILCSLW